jgi:NAD(P)-dependent dehydrogenase (short-subunit alcohol dehydrogenase family)
MKKIALITGGSRGLGKNMALNIASKGIDLIITYNTKKEEAEKTAAEIEKIGGKAVVIQLDVSNASNVKNFVSAVKDTLQSEFHTSKLDILINNAGIGNYEPIADTSEESLDHLYNIHFKSVFLLAKEFSLIMNEEGSVLNVSSGYSRFSAVGFSAYGALKAALDTLTRFQALEFAPLKIRVNSIAPGAIETDFAGGIVRDNSDINEYVKSLTALGRAGQPDDIGTVAAFLVSDEAKWINGQRIEVSGGIYL